MPIRTLLLRSRLFLGLSLVLPFATHAGVAAAVPDPAHSTCPASVTVSSSGSACFDVVVRDFVGNAIAGSSVVVDFGSCSVSWCPTQPHSGNLVTGTTDGSGTAHFCICATVGGACNATIYADGVSLCSPAVAQVCASQVPGTMSYQGVVTDNSGNIPPDGTHNFVFAIYDDPTLSGAHKLWTENQNAVQVTRGGFAVLLGRGTPAQPLTIAFDRPYYLSIAIDGGAELSPRTALASSPYALMARSVSDCGVSAGSIAANQVVKSLNALHDDITLVAGANVTITPGSQTLTISASGGGGGLGGSGTVNKLPKFTAAATVGDSRVSDDGTFIGLGRTTRVTTAEYFGVQTPNASGYGGMYMQTAGTAGLPFYGFSAGGQTAWTYLDGSDSYKWKLYNGGDRLTVTRDSKVGVLTTAPGATLDVNGTLVVRSPQHWPACQASTPLYWNNSTGQVGFGDQVCLMRTSDTTPLSNAADVLKLEPVSYAVEGSSSRDVGLVPAEVDPALRNLVSVDETGKPNAIRYDKLTLYLLEVVKTQQKQIDALKAEIERVKAR